LIENPKSALNKKIFNNAEDSIYRKLQRSSSKWLYKDLEDEEQIYEKVNNHERVYKAKKRISLFISPI